ncbi:MAG: flagellar hook-length control protein FliK [Albidovulum sp.]|uniref:flagellar hook-length control protein FliK n=1 Tax=Albidovulum sp. TaxID=1872424 RepID=UPI003C852AD4
MPKPDRPTPLIGSVQAPASGVSAHAAPEDPAPTPPTAEVATPPPDAPAKPVTPSGPGPQVANDPVVPATGDADLSPLDEAAGFATAGDTAPTARAEHRAAPAMQTLPLGLGQRLAETVARFPDRPVEVTLSPEELGRVRMSLSTHDGTLTMSVQADRPETLDLLRRNIDQLAQDFRDLGFRDLSFSFGDRPARQSPQPLPDDATKETVSEAPQNLQQAQQTRPVAIGADGGLDLRL